MSRDRPARESGARRGSRASRRFPHTRCDRATMNALPVNLENCLVAFCARRAHTGLGNRRAHVRRRQNVVYTVAIVANRGVHLAGADRLAVHAGLISLDGLGDGEHVLAREFRIRVATPAGLRQPGLAHGGVGVAGRKRLVRRAVAVVALGRVAVAAPASASVHARRKLLHFRFMAGGAQLRTALLRLHHIVVTMAGDAGLGASRLAQRNVGAFRKIRRCVGMA